MILTFALLYDILKIYIIGFNRLAMASFNFKQNKFSNSSKINMSISSLPILREKSLKLAFSQGAGGVNDLD